MWILQIRHAARRWIARPAFAATAVLTLALGIAATTTLFSVVDAVLLRPLPWRDADELVAIYVARPHWRQTPVLSVSWNTGNLSWPIFRDLQTRSQSFTEVATWTRTRPTLNGDRNELVYGMQVSAGFLPMLGVEPSLGRLFTAAEDESATDAVIVSYEAWQRRYGGSRDILGQRISLNERTHVIVGVLPPGFHFSGRQPPEFLLPWGNLPTANRTPGNHFMYGLGRLRPGVSLEAATGEADPLVRGTSKPEEKQARLVRLADDQLGRSKRPLWLLLGAASLLLLIACANAAGLQLGEAGARRYEMAVRLALGASRRRLAIQMLAESLVLGVVSIVVAMVLVTWLIPMLASLTPEELPRVGDVAVNFRIFFFAVAVGLATAVLFGVGPALTFSRVDPARWVHGGARGSSPQRSRAHTFLVAGEVALAVVLVAAATLLAETLVRMTSQPVGFRPDNLVVTSLRIPPPAGIEPDARVRRTDDLIATLAEIPGVEAVTATSSAPFSGSYGSNGISIEGKGEADANRHIVSAEYFRTLGIPVVKGRGFESADGPGSFTAVVTEEFERRLLDGDAVGRRFTLNKNVHEIVGVVPTAKHRRYTDEPGPAFYALHRQLPTWSTPTYIARTSVDARTMISTIRRAIEDFDPQASIVTIETMAEMMRRSVADERYRASVSSVFGVVALLLAAMGLYGLIARSVDDRRREMGVRLALGAQRSAVTNLVLRDALALVAGGLLVGIPAALGASVFVGSFLYGVTSTSPHIFVIAAALLAAAGLTAALVPARRAGRTDPIVALRAD